MSLTNIDIEGWNHAILGVPERLKLADGLDSFLFYYRRIDPRLENFVLSATMEVIDASGADFQTGYGLMVVDTVACPTPNHRYRNHALLGRFRTPEGVNYGLGLRIVGGYSDPEAAWQQNRRHLDPSRLFRYQSPVDEIRAGERLQFRLAKTDSGLEATLITDVETENIHFPGCDFLLSQDSSAVYVGFAIGGDIEIRITDIHFGTAPGRLSHTPKETIGHYIPDYPFSRNCFNGIEHIEGKSPQKVKITTADGPGKLASALLGANSGCEIVLADGVYTGDSYYIPKSCSGSFQHPVILKAEHSGKVILDGSRVGAHFPLMVLRADYWIIDGIIFQNAPSAGLMICGSHNVVRKCEASGNGDTGFLICAYPGCLRQEWPAYNSIEMCISHDNCDIVRRNADGFGAKLSVGEGNAFHSCKSFHNIDDGFDLYNKDIIGPISPVSLTDCEAWNNGWLSKEKLPGRTQRSGSGFKLGGEHLMVAHVLENCTSHHNARKGFNMNSNLAPILKNCREWGNLYTDKHCSVSFALSKLKVWFSSLVCKCFKIVERV